MVHLGGLRAEADELDAIVVAVPDNLSFPCLDTLQQIQDFFHHPGAANLIFMPRHNNLTRLILLFLTASPSCCSKPLSIPKGLSKTQGRQTSSLKVAKHTSVPMTLLDAMLAYAGLYASCAS